VCLSVDKKPIDASLVIVSPVQEDGFRSVRVAGWNASVEIDGVKIDNKFEPLKGGSIK